MNFGAKYKRFLRYNWILLMLFICGGCLKVQEENMTPRDWSPNELNRIGYHNPNITVDLGVGLWAIPLPMDFDGDGDLDLVVSCPDHPFSGIYFFENKEGSVEYPVFEPPVKIAEKHRNIEVSFVDGNPRLLVPGKELTGLEQGDLKEKEVFSVEEILKDFPKKKPRFNQWKYVDYDGDGNLDFIVGVDDWGDYGWDNAFDEAGNWTNGPLHGYVYWIRNEDGKYVNKGRLKAGGKVIDVYGAPSPNFADFDGDGDLDLICGEFLDKLTWFENTGSREQPEYAAGRYLENDNGVIQMDLQMIMPTVIDWNGDGHMDLIIGDEDGRVAYLKNTGKIMNNMPVFEDPYYFKQKSDKVKFGALSTPFSVDWDGDGDEDLIVGNTAGYIGFIENLDGGYPPKWAEPVLLEAGGETIRIQAGKSGSIQGPAEAKWGYTTLSVADWNGNGLPDLIVNSIWGKVLWYENVGTRTQPQLAPARSVTVDWGASGPPKPSWFWWDPESDELATQWRTTPYAIDWNEDGLTDLIMLDHEGYLAFFERTRKNDALVLLPGKRIFYGTDYSGYRSNGAVTDSMPGPLQLNTRLYGGSGRTKLCFTDWDGDGKKDLLINSINVTWLKNRGENEGRIYFSNEGSLSDVKIAGHSTSPAVVDWNKDQIPDLLVGAEDGYFFYMENPRNLK